MNPTPTTDNAPAPPRLEPLLPGPRRLTASARDVAELIEADPSLWPALTTCVADTNGQTIVHYAAAHGQGQAASLFGPDGVVSRWRALMNDASESRREHAQGRERVVTLRGHHSGHSLTVLFTVLTGDYVAPAAPTPEAPPPEAPPPVAQDSGAQGSEGRAPAGEAPKGEGPPGGVPVSRVPVGDALAPGPDSGPIPVPVQAPAPAAPPNGPEERT